MTNIDHVISYAAIPSCAVSEKLSNPQWARRLLKPVILWIRSPCDLRARAEEHRLEAYATLGPLELKQTRRMVMLGGKLLHRLPEIRTRHVRTVIFQSLAQAARDRIHKPKGLFILVDARFRTLLPQALRR